MTSRVTGRGLRAGTRSCLARACLALAATAMAPRAQAQAVPAGFEQGIFELRVGRIASETVTGLLAPSGVVLVPVERVVALTGVPTQRTATSLTVERARGAGLAVLDLRARQLTGSGALRDDELALVDGIYYLATARVAEWLGATVQADLGQLAVTMTRSPPFPVEQAAARAQRTAGGVAASGAGESRPGPAFEPHSGGAIVDWTASTTSSTRALAGSNGSLRGAAALFGGDVTAGVIAADDGRGGLRTAGTEWSYRRGFPGNRYVRQAQVGDLLGGSTQLRSLHGVTVTNGRLVSDPFFGAVPMNLDLPQGWQYEVYQDGQLIGFSDAATRGPLLVPLRYGSTPIQVRLVSPTGDESLQDLSYLIPQSQQQPGRLEYTAGGGRCTTSCTSLFFGDASYGLLPWLSVSAGAERQSSDSTTRTLPKGGLSVVTYGGWSAQLQAARESFERASFAYGGRGRVVGSASYQRTHSGVDVASVLEGLATTRWLSDAQLQLRGAPDARVQGWRLDATLEGVDGGGSERARTAVTADVQRGSVGLSYETDRTRALHEMGISVLSVLAPSARASAVLGTLLFDARSIHALELSTTIQAGRRGAMGMTGRWQHGSGLQLSAGYNGALGALRLASRLTAPANRPATLATTASGSVAVDGRRAPALFEGPGVGLAGVAGRVYYDNDGDGVFGLGDQPASRVRVVVNGTQVRSDTTGRYRSWNVIPYEAAEVAIDTLAFADPSWTLQRAHSALRATPGIFNQVDFPLVRTRELAGGIVADSGVATAGGVTLLLATEGGVVVQRIVTFSDGSFYVSRVRPGRYRLTVAPAALDALGAAADPASQTVVVTAVADEPVLMVPAVHLRRRAGDGGAKGPTP
jgi:hypothetical protein